MVSEQPVCGGCLAQKGDDNRKKDPRGRHCIAKDLLSVLCQEQKLAISLRVGNCKARAAADVPQRCITAECRDLPLAHDFICAHGTIALRQAPDHFQTKFIRDADAIASKAVPALQPQASILTWPDRQAAEEAAARQASKLMPECNRRHLPV